MSLASMTGFARAEAALGERSWHWELRSVNGRGLDVRLRLPAGFDRLEPVIRKRLQTAFARGSISVGLQMRRAETLGAVKVNETALATLVAACERLAKNKHVAAATADGLLAIKGVVEVDEQADDEAERERLDAVLLESLDVAIDRLAEMRRTEGARLRDVLGSRIEEIAELTRQAEDNPARSADAIAERLAGNVQALLDQTPALDPDRLHQEAVILATKADIREELDRLSAHIGAARDLLAADGAVGRKLDFLTQEFNREANTICSKSNDVSLTRIGLDLKSAIDQMREQVQNVE